MTVQSSIERQMLFAGKEIEKLMDVYPCLREVCKGLKTEAYPAAMFASSAFLGTLMTRCTYRFYHRPQELRRLNYSVFIIGDPGSGKSFVTNLYELLAGPIRKVGAECRESLSSQIQGVAGQRTERRWPQEAPGNYPYPPRPYIQQGVYRRHEACR